MLSHRIKILFPTSSGGHLAQLMQMRSFWGRHDRCWVTFDKEDANSQLKGECVYHCSYPTNRNIPNLLRNTLQAVKVMRAERPDLVVSTGAAVAVPYFWLARFFGARCIYVEVFDRVDAPTLTGKLVRPVADAMVVQWPEMKRVYEGAVDLGSVF